MEEKQFNFKSPKVIHRKSRKKLSVKGWFFLFGTFFGVALVVVAFMIASAVLAEPDDESITVDSAESVDFVEEVKQLRGIDISEYQQGNYQVVINLTDDFVICRALSNKTVDLNCDRAYQYAKRQGKLLGVYFWGNPKVMTDPEAYAKRCLDETEGYVGEAVFFLDFEPADGDYESMSPDWAFRWMQEFEKLSGVRPLIYLDSYMVQAKDWSRLVDEEYQLWLAKHGSDDGLNYGVSADTVGQWAGHLALHQYTTAGLGEQGTLDLDVFFGSEDDWIQLAKRRSEGSVVDAD